MNQEPQCKILPDGTKAWSLNGKLHRSNGPAIEHSNGAKEWRLYGKPHRLDGPAYERLDGFKDWYLNGKYLGSNDRGFWALWERLTNEQRSDWKLLQHAPWVKT